MGKLTERNCASDGDSAPDRVPRHIVPQLRHQRPTDQNCTTKQHNIRQQPNRSLNSRIAPRKLEVNRNIRDGDKARRIGRRHSNEQQNSLLILEVVEREHDILVFCQEVEFLLDAEEDEEDARDDEEGYDGAGGPGVDYAAEIDAEDEGDDSADG